MAMNAAEGARPLASRWIQAALRDVFAGAICSVLSIAYCLSYAALIFAGPLKPWLSYGVAITFLSAAVAAAVVALRSSLPFAIAGPDTSTSAVTAGLVAITAQNVIASGHTDLLMPTSIIMAISTAATGLFLSVLGFTRAGRAIRFVPYPVIGGFLGATGWLMLLGAVQVVTDQKLTLTNIDTFFSGLIFTKLAAATAVAIILELVLPRSRNPITMPAILAAAIVALHVALLIGGWSLGAAQADGWTFQPQPAAQLSLPWHTEALASFPWAMLPSLAGDLLAVMFVTTISLLLNTTGAEMATKREAGIERELKVLGAANLLSAALGGYASCLSVSRTTLAYTAGATGRLTGLTVAAVSAAFLVIDPGFLGYVPKYALGGLLFYLGVRLVFRWLVYSARQLLLIEYISLIAIALIIIKWGFIAGVLIGIVIGCATFALSASRVNAIKFSFDGSEYRSSLDRGRDELAILAAHGREIQGMTLQSYLFFGSANRLYQHVKAVLLQQTGCRFLVFDFRLVTGIDSSATHSFTQIKEAAAESGAKLALVNLSSELERAFRIARFLSSDVAIFSNMDRALESCEEDVIRIHMPEGGEAQSLRAWFAEALGSAELAETLAGRCRRMEIKAGDTIARQGDASDSMHFILEGRVGIVVELSAGHSIRVRSLGRHTTIGEMGLIAGRPRSATIQAEIDSVLYELPVKAYEQITRDQPTLSQALLSYVIAVMAERLSFASRAIGVLQR